MLRSPLPPLGSLASPSPHLLDRRCPSPLASPRSPVQLCTLIPPPERCASTASTSLPLSTWHSRKRAHVSSALPPTVDPNHSTAALDTQQEDYTRPLKRARPSSHGSNTAYRLSPLNIRGGDSEIQLSPRQRPGASPLGSALPTSSSPRVFSRSMDIDQATGVDVTMADEMAKRPRMPHVDSADSSSSIIPSNDNMPSSSPKSRTSPCSLPPRLHMKRPNLKKLSLALPSSSYSETSADLMTATATCPTPSFTHNSASSSQFGTPYTPGPPQTPALAMSLGRSTLRGLGRPSLLSLITQPSLSDDVPPTPGGASFPYTTMRDVPGKARARSHTAAELLTRIEPARNSSLTYPLRTSTFSSIDEAGPSTGRYDYGMPTTLSPQSASPNTSPSSSASGSTATTPSTSPPLPTTFSFNMPVSFPPRPAEPYGDGPIEVLPGVFLGAEESVHRFDAWASGSARVRVINVAQEVDDPFDLMTDLSKYGWGTNGKGKEKMKLAAYDASADRPEVEYCHVRWSHGELGLADMPSQAKLEDVLEASAPNHRDTWNFWEAIRWMEEGRRAGVPILIHCQCGVSRSATLIIAYTMALAATGAMPALLGHIRSMQDAYDFVKLKSSWIGPNHSLVFQLVDFARNLTTLLSAYVASPGAKPIRTSFPSSSDAELTEAEWARRRREFDERESQNQSDSDNSSPSPLDNEIDLLGMSMSPEEAGYEARQWDEAMVMRKEARHAV